MTSYIDAESVVNRVETSTTVTTVRRRRINFDQIQTAIKQLVNDASSDVRAQYGHLLSAGAVNQTLLQRRVASELMVRLAGSGAQGHELDVSLVSLQMIGLRRSTNCCILAVVNDKCLLQTTTRSVDRATSL